MDLRTPDGFPERVLLFNFAILIKDDNCTSLFLSSYVPSPDQGRQLGPPHSGWIPECVLCGRLRRGRGPVDNSRAEYASPASVPHGEAELVWCGADSSLIVCLICFLCFLFQHVLSSIAVYPSSLAPTSICCTCP